LGSEFVNGLIQNSEYLIFISDLSIIETVSTLAKKVRTLEMSTHTFKKVQQKFLGDVATDVFIIEKLTYQHNFTAINLINKYTTQYGLRTLDALQLAAAKELSFRESKMIFISSDQKLLQIVEKEGFDFINPELQ